MSGAELTNALADLAERVRLAIDEGDAASAIAAERALETGKLLCEAKEACAHGQWLPFLERSGVAERKAQRLMALGRSMFKSDRVSDLGITTACLIAERQKLPARGQSLIIYSGKKPNPNDAVSIFAHGDKTAWIWESLQNAGFYHYAFWSEPSGVPVEGPDDPNQTFVVATKRPIRGDCAAMLFDSINALFGSSLRDVRFTKEDDAFVGRAMREAAMGRCEPRFDDVGLSACSGEEARW